MAKSQAPTLTPEDRVELRALTDYISEYTTRVGKALTQSGWGLVMRRIKEIKENGYGYADQLLAFRYWVEVKKCEYKGYGIVAYIIEEALAYWRQQEDVEKKREEHIQKLMERHKLKTESKCAKEDKPLEVRSKPQFLL